MWSTMVCSWRCCWYLVSQFVYVVSDAVETGEYMETGSYLVASTAVLLPLQLAHALLEDRLLMAGHHHDKVLNAVQKQLCQHHSVGMHYLNWQHWCCTQNI